MAEPNLSSFIWSVAEKRAIFYKALLPPIEYGREREGVDLSKVVLTHYPLTSQGQRALALGQVRQLAGSRQRASQRAIMGALDAHMAMST